MVNVYITPCKHHRTQPLLRRSGKLYRLSSALHPLPCSAHLELIPAEERSMAYVNHNKHSHNDNN